MPQIYQNRWQHWRRMEITVESENKRKANPVKPCSSCKVGQTVLEMKGLLGKHNTAPQHLTYHSATQPWRGWRWHCQALLISILFLKLPTELKLAYDLQSSHAPEEPSTQEGQPLWQQLCLYDKAARNKPNTVLCPSQWAVTVLGSD